MGLQVVGPHPVVNHRNFTLAPLLVGLWFLEEKMHFPMRKRSVPLSRVAQTACGGIWTSCYCPPQQVSYAFLVGLYPVFLRVVDPVKLNKKHPQFSRSLRSFPQLGACAAWESRDDHGSTATDYPLKATRNVWQ